MLCSPVRLRAASVRETQRGPRGNSGGLDAVLLSLSHLSASMTQEERRTKILFVHECVNKKSAKDFFCLRRQGPRPEIHLETATESFGHWSTKNALPDVKARHSLCVALSLSRSCVSPLLTACFSHGLSRQIYFNDTPRRLIIFTACGSMHWMLA